MGTIRVALRPTTIGARGQNYDVLLNGETIVKGSRNPEYAACRALEARGLTGWLETYDEASGKPRFRMVIAWGAGRTIEETDRGLRCKKWKPFDLA